MLNAKKKYNRKAQIDSVAAIFFDKEKKKTVFFQIIAQRSGNKKAPFFHYVYLSHNMYYV